MVILLVIFLAMGTTTEVIGKDIRKLDPQAISHLAKKSSVNPRFTIVIAADIRNDIKKEVMKENVRV